MIRSKWLKLALPVAAAAAIVLVVGFWPESGGLSSGRVYALSDIPALFRSATVLHSHMFYYAPHGPEGMKCRENTRDEWVDLVYNRWASYDRNTGEVAGIPPLNAETYQESAQRVGRDDVCDGTYVMEVDHTTKEVEYRRISPMRIRLEVLSKARSFAPDVQPGEYGYKLVAHETLDGEDCEVWESITKPFGPDGRMLRGKLWFSPTSGQMGRFETSIKYAATDWHWSRPAVIQTSWLNTPAPAGTFSTEPPAGYKLINTKETAHPYTLDDCSSYEVGPYKVRIHAAFALPDASVLLVWSMTGADVAEQRSIAWNAVAGGALPNWPVQLYAFVPEWIDSGVVWAGRHLASTASQDRVYEWTLYVPNQTPTLGQFKALYRMDGQDSATMSDPARISFGGEIVEVRDAAEFNELVLGADAELSGGQAQLTNVSFEGVTALTAEIRASLRK